MSIFIQKQTKKTLWKKTTNTRLAQYYHENSKLFPDLMSNQKPKLHFSKPDYRRHKNESVVDLEPLHNQPPIQINLGDVLKGRRSSWSFHSQSVQLSELSQFLQYAAGVSQQEWLTTPDGRYDIRKRTYPSGGALYPIQLYIYANRIEGLSKGLYMFSSYYNQLVAQQHQNIDQEAIDSLTYGTDPQHNPLDSFEDYSGAAFYVFLTANVEHVYDKYGARGYRLVLLEAGHLAQNLLLTGTALRWNSVPLAGFYDNRVHELLNIDGIKEISVYMIPFGK